MQSNTLFKHFIIQSIISFLITGSLLGIIVSKIIVTQEIEHNIEIVTLTLGHSLVHWFETIEIDELTSHEIEQLDDEFESLYALGNITDIRIWSKDSNLIYSQDKVLIGQLTLEDEHYLKSQSNQTSHKLFNTLEENNIEHEKYGEEFIKVYLPIYDTHHDDFIGVFEVHRPFDSSRNKINTAIKSVLSILALGLMVLYFLLARVIYSSSNKLIKQNQEIQQKSIALQNSYDKLSKLYRSMIRALTNAIDARDKFTSGHSQRVAELTVSFSQFLGMSVEDSNQLEIAALLHDIGKLGVPESIITKPSKLTDEEYDKVQEHPLIGEKIVENIEELQNTVDVIKYHHEKYSGNGYPTKISKGDIPLSARIVALTDAYDAMISNRPYRKALTKDKAIAEILKAKGVQFDPELTEKFIEFIAPVD